MYIVGSFQNAKAYKATLQGVITTCLACVRPALSLSTTQVSSSPVLIPFNIHLHAMDDAHICVCVFVCICAHKYRSQGSTADDILQKLCLFESGSLNWSGTQQLDWAG